MKKFARTDDPAERAMQVTPAEQPVFHIRQNNKKTLRPEFVPWEKKN